MKKRLILLLVAMFGAISVVSAQDAAAVLDKYYQATGTSKMFTEPTGDYFYERFDTQGTNNVQSKVTISYPDKYRVEMSQMGQKNILVIDGDKGWLKQAAQASQEVPAANMLAIKKMYDLFNVTSFDRNESDFEYKGVSGDQVQLIATAKDPKTEMKTASLFFNKESGLLEMIKADMRIQGRKVKMEILYNKYKDFEGFKLPAEIITKIDGEVMVTMKFTKMESDYPVADWMFAQPE